MYAEVLELHRADMIIYITDKGTELRLPRSLVKGHSS